MAASNCKAESMFYSVFRLRWKQVPFISICSWEIARDWCTIKGGEFQCSGNHFSLSLSLSLFLSLLYLFWYQKVREAHRVFCHSPASLSLSVTTHTAADGSGWLRLLWKEGKVCGCMSLLLKEKAIGCLLPDGGKERAWGRAEGGLGRERKKGGGEEQGGKKMKGE